MRRRSASKILILTLLFSVLAPLGFAQQTMKIGVVNSQAVLESSVEGKRVMAQLQEKDKQNQADLAKMDEDIRRLETRLNTQRLTLTQEAMVQLSSDIEKKRTDRKRFAEDTLREMQDFTNRLFTKIQGELLPIIEQLGKDRGLDIILDLARSGAIYFSPTIDVTQDVIKAYDASKTQ